MPECSKIRDKILQINLLHSMAKATPAMWVHPMPHHLDRHNHRRTLEQVGVVHKPNLTRTSRTNVRPTPYHRALFSFDLVHVLTLVFTSLSPIYHSGLGSYYDYSPRTDPVPSFSNPGGFRSDLVDFNYGYETESPHVALPGTTAVSHSDFSSDDAYAQPQPGGFVMPDAYSYGRISNDTDPGGDPPWIGGFGGFR